MKREMKLIHLVSVTTTLSKRPIHYIFKLKRKCSGEGRQDSYKIKDWITSSFTTTESSILSWLHLKNIDSNTTNNSKPCGKTGSRDKHALQEFWKLISSPINVLLLLQIRGATGRVCKNWRRTNIVKWRQIGSSMSQILRMRGYKLMLFKLSKH